MLLLFLALKLWPRYQQYARYQEYLRQPVDPRENIQGIWMFMQLYHQDNGVWPASVEQLSREKYMDLRPSARAQWEFRIVGSPPELITAVSTPKMKYGAGQTTTYNVRDGTWSGFVLPAEDRKGG